MAESNTARRRKAGALTAATVALAMAGTAAVVDIDALRAQTAASPPVAALQSMPSTLADVVERVSPAVVNIQVEKQAGASVAGTPFPEGVPEFFKRFFDEDMMRRFGIEPDGRGGPQMRPPQQRRLMGVGSGFIISSDGYIVTNHHVVDEADDITVNLQSGKTLKATLVGSDQKTDLALIKVDAEQPLPAVQWGDSESARVGDWVIAVGNPFGLGGSVTTGIISARGRTIGAGPYDDFLQISAPINQGNSGGPTFNISGEVIGVNTAIYSPSGGSVGIGFAIPSSLAQNVVSQLRESGHVERGWLGVTIQNVTEDLAAGLNLDRAEGALVAQVSPGGPADEAGLQQGDVILSVNGQDINMMRALPRVIAGLKAGSTANVAVWRNGAERTIDVKIGKMPENPQMAAVGRNDSDPAATAEDALGLQLASIDQGARQRFGIADGVEGVVVIGVSDDSPAAGKGISAGDVILSVENERVSTPRDVIAKVEKAKRDNRRAVLMLLSREGSEQRYVALPVKTG